MKLVLIALFALSFGAAAQAAETMSSPQISAKAPTVVSPFDRGHVAEAGAQVSAINDGSIFASVGFFHEFESGFALGGRALLPAQYNRGAQLYEAQAAGRFMLGWDLNQMFGEVTLSEGIFSKNGDNVGFVLVGADYGYMREVAENIRIGGSIGVDYTRDRVADSSLTFNSPTLYSRVALTGSLYF